MKRGKYKVKRRKKGLKTTAILTAMVFIISVMAGFTSSDGFGYVYYDSKMIVHNDVYYNNVIGSHPKHGIEQAYFVTAGPKSAVKPYVYTSYTVGKTSMDAMISDLNKRGYKVVAGINGDLYDTGKGTPKGVVIHEGQLLTTGYAAGASIAFDENGKAFACYGAPTISLSAKKNNPADGTSVDWNTKIGFLNVPHGGGKSLHLFDSWNGNTTGTTAPSCEVVIDVAGSAKLYVGNSIKGKVSQVLKGVRSTPIGSNQVVLSCASDSTFFPSLSNIVPGSEVTITVDDAGSGLSKAKEAIGSYHLLAQNGKIITTGTNLNPRTCVGIKPDGSVVLYVVDGRQKWTVSAGLGLTEVAKHMMAIGCTTVFNMDGGGSSNIAVRMPGKDVFARVVNSISDKTQRRTANGLFFVYAGNGNKQVENLSLYPALAVMLPGTKVQIKAYASDDRYEPVLLTSIPAYRTSKDFGSIDSNGNFTAGQKLGMTSVTAEYAGKIGSSQINIVNDITIIPSVNKLNLSAGQSKDINITAKFGTVTAISNDNLFKWNCDKEIGVIDGNGVFKAGNISASGNITVSYNNKSVRIPVSVTGAASSSSFSDIRGHWAEAYINQLSAKGLVSGIGNGMFGPENKLTRSQFLAMLAKLSGEDVSKSPAVNFKDVPGNEWYYAFVNWGSAAGIVKGTDTGMFMPNGIITREQMALMLDKYMEYKKLNISKNINMKFQDAVKISDWAKNSVVKAVNAGILTGKAGGRFDPAGSATRAEAATVIWKLNQH